MQKMAPKILIADDSPSVHEGLRSALFAENFTNTVQALDGVECLEALDQGVDMAFIDTHMPRMSGMEALWAARIASNKTFVTLLSGRSSQHCIELARKLDAYELLLKPLQNDDISAIVKTYKRISAPIRVLLVDETAKLRKILRKVLMNSIFHLEVEEVSDEVMGLVSFKAQPFDVVFLDVNRPKSDGIHTLSHIMRIRPETKVVMMSAEDNRRCEREALDHGAAAIMYKPFFPTEIDAVLHQIFGLRSPKLATNGHIRNFDINIHGRTVAVQHAETGHLYQYVWFREPPYLRLPQVRENDIATIPAETFATDVEKVALLELENAGLL